ncbi:MAG TPA: hypothetical protein VML19_15150 [Verrucomicrobiae bacterium]|nr:hypothetical protein [Verrucomicrobiae bacterium]
MQSRGFVSRWLVPDVAMAVGCVTLFYCLFLFQGYQKLFRDSDAGWHIRTGESILQSGRLPRTDPYSFSRPNAPWFDWEWAADTAAGAVDRAGGLSAVALLFAGVIAAVSWLWFRLHWEMGGNFLLACAMAPLMLSTCNIHWLARPHVMGWVFLLMLAGCMERERKSLLAIGILTALWANFHASFFLAPAIAVVYAGGAAIRRILWNEGEGPSWYLKAAIVSALAGLINPYGWGLYRHVFDYLRNSDLLARIGEFQSFDFHADGSGEIISALLIGMAGGALALLRRRPEHFALAAVLSAAALRSARALPIAALVLLPIANGAISAALQDAGGHFTRGAREAVVGFLEYSRRLRLLDEGFRGYALIPAVLLACWGILQTPALRAATGFPADQFPVAAYAHIPDTARLFAPDKYGGYLIYRSAGVRKVFFDGRSDFYGAEFLKGYARLVQARPGWQGIWEGYGFTHALLPVDAPLSSALQQAGWRIVYQDHTTLLLAPPAAQALLSAAPRLIPAPGARNRHFATCYKRKTPSYGP